jgi:hypothetical protein
MVRRLVANANIPTNNPGTGVPILCADCGQRIGKDCGPRDGWQLEDGRTVCHACCVADTRKIVMQIIKSSNVPDQRPPTGDVGLAEGAIGGSLHPVVGASGPNCENRCLT